MTITGDNASSGAIEPDLAWLGERARAANASRCSPSGLELAAPRRREEFFRDASELLVACGDWQDGLQELARLAVPRFADWCIIETDDGAIQPLISIHVQPDRAWLAAELLRSGAPRATLRLGFRTSSYERAGRLVDDVRALVLDPRTRHPAALRTYQTLGVHSVIVVPIQGAKGALGRMHFFTLGGRAPLSCEDLLLAEELARLAAQACSWDRHQEERSNARRLRDELLTSASHELRTPLAAMLLKLQSLESALRAPDVDHEAVANGMRRVMGQTLRLAGIVDALLDVSRLSTGMPELRLEKVRLSSVARAVVNRLSETARAVGSPLLVQVRNDVIGGWDRLRLEQIVENLISNALEFAPKTTVRVEIERQPGAAVLRVSDGGPGIVDCERERVFERFYQGPRHRRPSGLGLGLYIARQLAHAHGGALEIDGEGEGATFVLTLPLFRPRASRLPGGTTCRGRCHAP